MFATKDEHYIKVLNSVVNFISFKQRTQKEVEDKLERVLLWKKDKLSDEEIEDIRTRVLEELSEQNLINDGFYAVLYVEQKSKAKNPSSPKEIANFLYKKGVARGEIEQALKNYTLEQEKENVKRIMEKKGRMLPEKLKNYVLRRGFSGDAVYKV